MALIEIGECVFDQRQYDSSHGFESLNPIAQEAFVNHLHLTGDTDSSRSRSNPRMLGE